MTRRLVVENHFENHICFEHEYFGEFVSWEEKDSPVWDFFIYCKETDKSLHNILDPKTEKSCGTALLGKISSNLISHLQQIHKVAYSEYQEKHSEKDKAKTGLKRKFHAAVSDSAAISTEKTQTLQACLSKRHVTWPTNSMEHQQREWSVVNMLVDSGYPVTMVDHLSFRVMMQDPKFKLPGKYVHNYEYFNFDCSTCDKQFWLLSILTT